MQIRIADRFIQQVATEAFDRHPDRLKLIPEFRIRDRQIEAIGLMLLAELQQDNLGGRLYIDSLVQTIDRHRSLSVSTPTTDRTREAIIETTRSKSAHPHDSRHCFGMWI